MNPIYTNEDVLVICRESNLKAEIICCNLKEGKVGRLFLSKEQIGEFINNLGEVDDIISNKLNKEIFDSPEQQKEYEDLMRVGLEETSQSQEYFKEKTDVIEPLLNRDVVEIFDEIDCPETDESGQ